MSLAGKVRSGRKTRRDIMYALVTRQLLSAWRAAGMVFHDLYWLSSDVHGVLVQIFAALKPGARFLITDHAAPEGTGAEYALQLEGGQHRIEEAFAIKEVQDAGFELVPTSELLGVPEDDRTKPFFRMDGAFTDRFALQFGMFALSVAWWSSIRRSVGNAPPRALTSKKKAIVKACLAFLPIQLILLIFGEPHGLTDETGVIGTMLQWVLLAYAFYPGSEYRGAVA